MSGEILKHFFGKTSKLGSFFGLRAGIKRFSSKKPSAGLSQVLSACPDQRVKMKLTFWEKESKSNFLPSAKQFQTLSKKFVSFDKGASIVSRGTLQKTCFPRKNLCLNFRKLSKRNWVPGGNISAELS